MKKQYENMYLVFQVAEGPKIIIESLNTYEQEGWEVKTMISVAGDKLVAFMARESVIEDPDPAKSAKKKLDSIWSADTEES